MEPNLNDQSSIYKYMKFPLASVSYWIIYTTLSESAYSLENWRVIRQTAFCVVYTFCFICRHHDPLHTLIRLKDLVT